MGQRVDDCVGSGAAAENLPEGDDSGCDFGFADVRAAIRRGISGGCAGGAFAGDGAWAQVARLIGGTWHGANWLGFLLCWAE